MSTSIVMVPGLLCSPQIWAPQQDALWPYASVQIASTLGADTIEEIAASVLASAPPHFQLAGISLGGYICFEMWRQAPERIERLALLDTSARPDVPDQSAGRRQMVATAEKNYLATAVDGLMAVLHPTRHDDPQLRKVNEQMARSVGLAGFKSQTEAAITRPDSRPTLPGIRIPTLVMVGDADALTPRHLSEEIVAGIPDARLVDIPESGHGSTIEQPDFVNAELVSWFTNR
jgi:pimeloyl-ACP methyl ester carboxylesterase